MTILKLLLESLEFIEFFTSSRGFAALLAASGGTLVYQLGHGYGTVIGLALLGWAVLWDDQCFEPGQ
jgi:hypothetical protein